MVTIAVDAMGGDKAPAPEIEGAILAAREYGHRILLVGDRHTLEHGLQAHGIGRSLPIEIVHATERIWEKMFALAVPQRDRKTLLEAIACVDCAIWDVIGKAAKIPVVKLLGGYREEA